MTRTKPGRVAAGPLAICHFSGGDGTQPVTFSMHETRTYLGDLGYGLPDAAAS